MKPKLADVAKEAGVSPTTVSRVINDHGYLSNATKDKVHAAMDKLNYQPNSLARSLHGKKTNLIGVIFPSITNPFYAELIQKVENQLFNHGYKIILCNSADNKEKERAYLRMLIANQVDGIIAGAHNLGIEEYQKIGLPIVSFDRQYTENIPIISSDNYAGGMLAAQELFDAGCRKIQFVGSGSRTANPTGRRLTGYRDKIKQLALEPHIFSVDFNDPPAVKLLGIKQLLKDDSLDGVVCSDDLTAILVMQAAQQVGLNIPTDLKVIGYDGTEFMRTYYPQLSTIVQPLNDLVALLIKTLFERIDQPDAKFANNHFVLPVEVKRAETTRK
ncbi:LacI family DNA-binding transcriptional regulator [Ligilactobacillus acidipiscis]|uniref:LacI family DNA-binding transcriptional regulator n=1 Tax=Ligilactobacillus acidipiscis TaxID=89059 RepID=UPI0022DFE2D2|nr:LacI family DNA-binding transcriptional regulator [Ligilactobacillus acidipiscis]